MCLYCCLAALYDRSVDGRDARLWPSVALRSDRTSCIVSALLAGYCTVGLPLRGRPASGPPPAACGLTMFICTSTDTDWCTTFHVIVYSCSCIRVNLLSDFQLNPDVKSLKIPDGRTKNSTDIRINRIYARTQKYGCTEMQQDITLFCRQMFGLTAD